jgi:hypothetical protein
MHTCGRVLALTVGLSLLGAPWPAAAGSGFPLHRVQRIELPAARPVQALLYDPQTRHIFAAQGRRIEVYALGGSRLILQRRLAGTVNALARTGAGEIVAATSAPARLVFLSARTLTVEHRHALEAGSPSALLYDRTDHLLFLEDRSSGTIVRVDPTSGRALGRVQLGGALGQMAGNGRGTLYVVNTERDSLEVIDARSMRDAGSIALRRCHRPRGLAMDTIGRRLFVGCANDRALIVDADLGFTFVRLPIPGGAQRRAVFAFHPLGARGWKGGVFFAGTTAVAAIQMQAFVRYRDRGQLPLPTPCTALALAAPAAQLWLALAPPPGGRAELWVLGAARLEVK